MEETVNIRSSENSTKVSKLYKHVSKQYVYTYYLLNIYIYIYIYINIYVCVYITIKQIAKNKTY